jgi:hypothetical protein
MKAVVKITTGLVNKEFHRKHFKEFEYIKLEPPTWIKWLTFLVVLSINIIIGIIVVNNNQS